MQNWWFTGRVRRFEKRASSDEKSEYRITKKQKDLDIESDQEEVWKDLEIQCNQIKAWAEAIQKESEIKSKKKVEREKEGKMKEKTEINRHRTRCKR